MIHRRTKTKHTKKEKETKIEKKLIASLFDSLMLFKLTRTIYQ